MSKELEALKDLTVSAMCCGAMEMSLVEKNNAIIKAALEEHEQYKAIKEENSVDLVALFKQPYCTIFIKKDYGENYKNVIEEHTLYSIIPQEKCIIVTFDTTKFYWKDYGKTWAFTREELEK